MKTLIISKPNKSKTELLIFLESQLPNFKDVLKQNNVKVDRVTDGFTIKLEKSVIFMKFYLNALILCEEDKYIIKYETNAPESKIKEFELKILDFFKRL